MGIELEIWFKNISNIGINFIAYMLNVYPKVKTLTGCHNNVRYLCHTSTSQQKRFCAN